MSKELSLILLITLFLAGPARALEVAVVQSSAARPYEELHREVSQALSDALPGRGLKKISNYREYSFLLGADNPETARQRIKARNTDLIIAIGGPALTAVAEIKTIPIIALLVTPNQAAAARKDGTNIVTFPLKIAPGQALKAVSERLPQIRQVGVVYDPERTGQIIAASRQACPELKLITRHVTASRQVGKATRELAGRIDLLWLTPDLTAITPLTEASYLLFSIQEQVPLLAFTPAQLQHGATFAYVFDYSAMAKQMARLAHQIARGVPMARLKAPSYSPGKLLVNEIALSKLGLEEARP
ncbi:MAG: ABC transporter substrate binding protein [Thermodesulfobacteriota bacterium]